MAVKPNHYPQHLTDLQLDQKIEDIAARLEALSREFDLLLSEQERRDRTPQFVIGPHATARLACAPAEGRA